MMNYPSMQQGAYRPPFQQQQVLFQQQPAPVQQQFQPQPLQLMPDQVPRTITFQEPNQTNQGQTNVNLTELELIQDEAEMTPATDETPFLVACFDNMTNHEIDRMLGIEDPSDDCDDSNDDPSVHEVHMLHDDDDDDNDDWWKWGPEPAPVANPSNLEWSDDDDPPAAAQPNLKTTGLEDDDEVMTEQTQMQLKVYTPKDKDPDTIVATDNDEVTYMGSNPDGIHEIEDGEEGSFLDYGFNCFHERGPDLVPHCSWETVYSMFSQQEYLLDSGAQCHVTYDPEYLEVRSLENTKIKVGNNSTCDINVSGQLNLKIDNNGGIKIITLDRVYLVHSFSKRVISIPRLVDMGYHFVFKKKVCVIIAPDKKFLQILASTDGMFYLTILRRSQRAYKPDMMKVNHKYNQNYNLNTEVIPYKPKVLNINDIHDKFGHVGETVLRKTIKHLGYTVSGALKCCDACKMAKARAKGVKKHTKRRSTTPGERMYVNISGPFSMSLGGSRFWLEAVDDATCMGFTYFMKTKDEIGHKLGQLLQQVKALKHTVLIIRCDNAKETTKHIQDLARAHGLLVEFISPYTPQMNGVVERRFAGLKLRSQAMLNQADLSPDLRNKL